MKSAVVALLAVLGGCTLITDSFLTNEFSGDPFPTRVDTSTGAIVIGIHASGTAPDDHPNAVLDLLSPFTLIDPGTDAEPSLSYVDLTLLGKDPRDGALTLPRARFPEAQLISLHPCGIPDGADLKNLPACVVGTPTVKLPFDAVVGADVLAGDAVRLRLDQNEIFVLPDIGGGDRGRTLDCDAVFGSPYRGGGTLELAGTELPFGNRRITLQACLGADPDPDPQLATDGLPGFPEPLADSDRCTANAPCTTDQRVMRETSRKMIADSMYQRGADALFVVSTSIGISILGAAAYGRYVLAHPGAPALDALPPDAVYLASGLVQGRRATIDRIALVAASSSNALAPCRQLYAHRLLSALGSIDSSEFTPCPRDPDTGNPLCQFDSPCKDSSNSAFCATPGILELTQAAGIDVLVVDDTEPTLQALRTELRPDQPEVDGILGTRVLGGAEIDVDYPHDRLLARCPGGRCTARPALAQENDRCQINRCIKGLQDFRNQAPAGKTPDDWNLPGCPFTPPG